MNQKWHTTINWMEDSDMCAIMQKYGFDSSTWKPDLREALHNSHI